MFPRRQRAPHRAAQLSRLGRTESLERCEQCWVSRRTAVIRGGGWRSGARLKPTYGAVVGPQGTQLLSGLLHALTLTLPVLNTLVSVCTDNKLRNNIRLIREAIIGRKKMKC